MPAPTHGLSRVVPEYRIWIAMKSRCGNPRHKAYHRYGGRGIKVCAEWMHSFETFYADMGSRPSPEYSIDRSDSNKHYEPSNCRWATRLQQNNNMRSNKKVEWEGQFLSISEIYRLLKPEISKRQLAWRIEQGWSVRDAVFTKPFAHYKPRTGVSI